MVQTENSPRATALTRHLLYAGLGSTQRYRDGEGNRTGVSNCYNSQ